MPATKKQTKRLELLDELLSRKKWTVDELFQRVNDKMDGIEITKRSFFRDIQDLIDAGAPLHRPEKGDQFYYYTQKFSLKNVPIDEDDVASLKKAIDILKQVENFELLQEVDGVIRKLENRIHTNTKESTSVVQFEKHTTSAGQEHINDLFDAIQSQLAIRLWYQPFLQDTPTEQIVHPYLLKEFRNRWFLIGRQGSGNRITTYALDRIKKIKNSDADYIPNDLFDPAKYYENVIGVTVQEDKTPDDITIKVYKSCIPYILSKPIHKNQSVLKQNQDGSLLIQLSLIVNYELKSILLSYGDGIEVKKPKSLRDAMSALIDQMSALYKTRS